MDDKESALNPLRRRYPDRLQQVIYRLQKKYEDLSFEDRNLRIKQEIGQLDENENDRNELLRRLD